MDFINKDLKISQYSEPFTHVIKENFLNLEFYNEIEKNFLDLILDKLNKTSIFQNK